MLPEAERTALAGVIQEEAIEPGRAVTRVGDFGYAFYAIEEGAAEVKSSDDELLRTLGPGDTFGEIALLLAGRRSATVVATTPMRVLTLFGGDFLRIRDDVPAFEAALRDASSATLAS
jgi:CRP-like cAMP-binding protein